MPLFQPRNRVQILRESLARVVARSRLVRIVRNGVVFHLLSASANEDAEQYVQMARLKTLQSLDQCQGSDLDERAAEVLPSIVKRYPSFYATTTVVFSRPGTVGLVPIPVGSIAGATDSKGQVRYRTTSAGSILGGNTLSGAIPVVATVAGVRGNTIAGQINQMVTRIAGVTTVTNPSDVVNGFDRESDQAFLARIKAFVQASSRGTVTAVKAFANNVMLANGQRVLFAHVVESILPTGIIQVYIDDGTGAVETYDSTFIGSPDTFLISALGGERDLYTTSKPIRDDGSFVLEINTGAGFVTQVRHADYELNPGNGQVELSAASYPTGLAATNSARANYRFYTGLIAETQRVLDGDPADAIRTPGVVAAGIQARVLAPQVQYQSVTAQCSVLEGFVPTVVLAAVASAIQDYVNTLDIGADVLVAKIYEVAMNVSGMENFHLADLSGSSPPTDQIILDNGVARIVAASIHLT